MLGVLGRLTAEQTLRNVCSGSDTGAPSFCACKGSKEALVGKAGGVGASGVPSRREGPASAQPSGRRHHPLPVMAGSPPDDAGEREALLGGVRRSPTPTPPVGRRLEPGRSPAATGPWEMSSDRGAGRARDGSVRQWAASAHINSHSAF